MVDNTNENQTNELSDKQKAEYDTIHLNLVNQIIGKIDNPTIWADVKPLIEQLIELKTGEATDIQGTHNKR